MQNEQLMALSHRVRRHVIKMATNGGCFAVSTLSLALDNHWFKPALMAEVLEYEGFTAAKIAASVLQRIHEARS